MLVARGCASKVQSRQLLRLTSKLAPVHRSSFAFAIGRAASSSAKAGAKPPALSNIPSVKLPPRSTVTLSPQKQRAAYNADKLYQARKTALFRAPSHFAYLLGSWVLSVACISSAAYTYSLGLWKEDKSSNLPFFVPVANLLTLLTIGCLGSWILIRSTNLVTAIDLIKTVGGTKMRISVRRPVPVPFIPQRKIIVAPYELLLPTSAIRPAAVPKFAEMPQEGKNDKSLRFGTWAAKKISFTIWSFFTGSRKIFTHEGFLIASVEGQKAGLKIDIEGTFPNGVWNLVDVSTLGEE